MGSKKWGAILRLLKKRGKSIRVVEAEAIAGHGGYVFLDGEGFKEWSGVVGEAAAYTQEKPEIKLLNTFVEVLGAVRECDNSTTPQLPEKELVEGLLKDLEEIVSVK